MCATFGKQMRRESLGGLRLDVELELALQGPTMINRSELRTRRRQAPFPLGVFAECGFALLWMCIEVAIAGRLARWVSTLPALLLPPMPQIERKWMYGYVCERLDVEEVPALGEDGVLEMDALVVIFGGAGEYLLGMRLMLAPVAIVVVRSGEALITVWYWAEKF